jgi:hypothetical protein
LLLPGAIDYRIMYGYAVIQAQSINGRKMSMSNPSREGGSDLRLTVASDRHVHLIRAGLTDWKHRASVVAMNRTADAPTVR